MLSKKIITTGFGIITATELREPYARDAFPTKGPSTKVDDATDFWYMRLRPCTDSDAHLRRASFRRFFTIHVGAAAPLRRRISWSAVGEAGHLPYLCIYQTSIYSGNDFV